MVDEELVFGNLCVEYDHAVWVIEIKFIHGCHRAAKRKHVQTRALEYASWVRLKTGPAKLVHAAVFTNVRGLEFVEYNVAPALKTEVCDATRLISSVVPW